MTTDNKSELQKWMDEAEFHAFSVRQLIAQRSRLFETFKLAGAIAKSPSQKPGWEERFAKVLKCADQSTSQLMQDIYGLLLSHGKENGFFVEFGACDGLLISNTLLMEKEFGWRGILSEPAPRWLPALKENRKCIIDPRCVWSTSGQHIEFAEFSDDEYHTQSTAANAAGGKSSVSNTYKVETISLLDLLQTHNAPQEIDFISIDTEGTEYEILKAFPFEEYRFGLLCVEHHTDATEKPIKDLLHAVGYRQVLRHVSGHDGFYIHDSNKDISSLESL